MKQTATQNGFPAYHAQRYLARGYCPLPVPAGSKGPIIPGWQHVRFTPDQIPGAFPVDSNIGLILGEPSKGLVDVDLDCPAAVGLAVAYLPKTGMIGGRALSQRSHWWYLSPGAVSARFLDIAGKVLIELRSTGGQTLVYPSKHPSGDVYEWDGGTEPGEPAAVDAAELLKIVKRIAAGALLARSWPFEGSRHTLALALGGLLARANIPQQAAMSFVGHVATIAGDDEVDDRRHAVATSYDLLARGGRPTGGPNAVKILGVPVLDRFSEWLDLRDRKAGTAQAGRQDSDVAADPLSNALTEWTTDDKGNEKQTITPRTMEDVLREVLDRTGGWPRRVDGSLFVDDPGGPLIWLEESSALFGWLQSTVGLVEWRRAVGCVAKIEVHCELQRTSDAYTAIEQLPHVPEIPGHYYTTATKLVKPGDGEALSGLLDCFSPSTAVDRDLIQAAFMTVLWGGPSGARPAFVITSDEGRGMGKSKLAEMIGRLFGGCISFSKEEDIQRIKGRLLDPSTFAQRVALLDNVKTAKFSWADLEALVTAPTINGWRIYSGDRTRPNTLTWLITLNGASLSTDMAQRCVVVKVERPRRIKAWEERTRIYVEQHRNALIGDIVGALQADRCELAEYSRWAGWEGDILERLPDPPEAQKVILERQQVTDVEAEEGSVIEDHFRESLEGLGYQVAFEPVFIPSRIARVWLAEALGTPRITTTGSTRLLKQLIAEKRLNSVHVQLGNAIGRGFIWQDMESGGNVCDKVTCDLYERFENAKSPHYPH